MKSAPGVDGFSNALIKKIWAHIRIPLHKYSLCCFTKGELTQNFRCASVRLIPKKGNTDKLNNWRPISLLSNFYKIISRALNNRLNKIINRVCSRGQKGYNSMRVTQEVLINVWEPIHHCRKNNIRGAVVAIDMAKAFDTLSNEFLDEVMEFLGLGLISGDGSQCVALTEWLALSWMMVISPPSSTWRGGDPRGMYCPQTHLISVYKYSYLSLNWTVK